MRTIFNKLDFDWVNVKNKCRTTVNKEYTNNEATTEFKKKILISEHTPIRLLNVDWSWKRIKSWITVHWVRHRFTPFVASRREDRTPLGNDIKPRDVLPQGTAVNMDGYANAQNLIDIMRKRLCYKAHLETKAYADDFKKALHDKQPEMADVLVPNCIYRAGCPEFKACGFYQNFLKRHEETLSMYSSIQERYDTYNKEFYANFDRFKDGDK